MYVHINFTYIAKKTQISTNFILTLTVLILNSMQIKVNFALEIIFWRCEAERKISLLNLEYRHPERIKSILSMQVLLKLPPITIRSQAQVIEMLIR